MSQIINITQKEIQSLYWQNVGDEVQEKKNPAEALKAYEKALEIIPNPPPYRRCLLERNIGLGYAYKKEFSTALSHYLKAWENKNKIPEQERSDLAGDMADCYFHTSQFAQAAQFYQKKLEMLHPTDEKSQKIYELTRYNIAKAYLKNGDYKKALPLLQLALNYYQKTLSSPDKCLSEVCKQMALCYEQLREWKESILFTQ